MTLINPFDPWQSALCTCPSKLTFNPYTGCDHACVYCYASTYIPRFLECRPKKNLLARLGKEASKLKGELVSIANSSDPYPNLEKKTGLTRDCLDLLVKQNCRLQIITKSDLVLRDLDLLKRVPSMVSLTITTENEETARLIEPCAPSPSKRLDAVETLICEGIAMSVRIDPIIPFVNDSQVELLEILASLGVKHITSSTLKVSPPILRRLTAALPNVSEHLLHLYLNRGERAGRYFRLPIELRAKLLGRVAKFASRHDIGFGVCREALGQFSAETCDGSHLLNKFSSGRVQTWEHN